MRYATKAGLITALWLAGAASATADVSEKLTACFGCHGPNGQSEIENVPSIAAQVPAYSLIQLVMFRDKLRLSDTMNDAARDLSDSDIQPLADALAALPPPKPLPDPVDQARFERARALARQNHCDVCHRPDFSAQQTVPRLADQREDYLLKTLRDYKSGARRAYEPIMGRAGEAARRHAVGRALVLPGSYPLTYKPRGTRTWRRPLNYTSAILCRVRVE